MQKLHFANFHTFWGEGVLTASKNSQALTKTIKLFFFLAVFLVSGSEPFQKC